MSEKISISCNDCTAVCCKSAVVIRLSSKEANFLKSGGSDLECITPPSESRDGLFETYSSCGFLAMNPDNTSGVCTVYDDPSRPRACSELLPDSDACNYMRRGVGLPAN